MHPVGGESCHQDIQGAHGKTEIDMNLWQSYSLWQDQKLSGIYQSEGDQDFCFHSNCFEICISFDSLKV